MTDLVTTIKELQRSDFKAKEQWWAYCDAMGGGVRDPARHDESFMQEFLDNYNAGRRFEASVPAASSGGGGSNGAGVTNDLLAQLCKEGQKRSPNWKQTWAQYCMHYGGGRNDPSKHDASFISGFLDYVAGRGIMAMGASGAAMGMGGMGGFGGPPAKRARVGSPGPGMMGGMFGGMSNGKEDLVQRIKTFQKSSPEAKEQWGGYCDQHLGGVRDPSRHDAATLKQFATNYAVP